MMLIIVAVLVFTILAMVVGCFAVYVQLKYVKCCRRFRGEEERTFARRVKEIVSQSIIQDKGGSTPDAGREESHGMIMIEHSEDYSGTKRLSY
jgi:hypothetical protein